MQLDQRVPEFEDDGIVFRLAAEGYAPRDTNRSTDLSDSGTPVSFDERLDRGTAFRRFEDAMRKLVRVPKKEVDAKIAAKRLAKKRSTASS